ncbi:MAG: MFS transporter [Clostridia bacterium]|nr:MFS transporter [Clostridia bacterium]
MGLGAKVKDVLGIEGKTGEVIRPMIAYDCANITLGGAGYPLNQFHQQFLAYVEGMKTGAAGKITLITGLWDAVSDPVMGIITDRTKSRLGRHRPYLLFSAIPFAIAYLFKWTSFGISGRGDANATWWWYLFAGLLYATFMTIMSIPHTAMLPTVAPGYFERTQYKIIEYAFNSVGQVTSYVFTALALSGFNIKTALTALPTPSPGDRPHYAMVGLVLMLWFSWSPILCFFKVKEPSSKDQVNPPLDVKSLLREYALVFANRSFRQYFVISLFFSMSRYFCNYADQYFMVSVTDTYNIFISMNIISGIAEFSGSPINYLITRYKGKTACGKILGPLMVIGIAINSFISYTTPKFIKYAVVIVSAILYNIGFSGPGFVAENIQPDITDVDEMITGRRREGVIATFKTLFSKTISSLMGYAVGTSLEWFGYDPNIKHPLEQSKRTLLGLRLNYAVIPSVLAFFCVLSIFRYSMTKTDHETIKRIIKEKHETGECEITAEEKKRLEKIAGRPWEKMWIGQQNQVRNSVETL